MAADFQRAMMMMAELRARKLELHYWPARARRVRRRHADGIYDTLKRRRRRLARLAAFQLRM